MKRKHAAASRKQAPTLQKLKETAQAAGAAELTLAEHLRRIRALRRPLGGKEAQEMVERKMWIERVRKLRHVPLPDQPDFDLLEVSFYLNADKQTVKRMIDDGELKAEKKGRSWFVSRRELRKYIDKLEKIRAELNAERML